MLNLTSRRRTTFRRGGKKGPWVLLEKDSTSWEKIKKRIRGRTVRAAAARLPRTRRIPLEKKTTREVKYISCALESFEGRRTSLLLLENYRRGRKGRKRKRVIRRRRNGSPTSEFP